MIKDKKVNSYYEGQNINDLANKYYDFFETLLGGPNK